MLTLSTKRGKALVILTSFMAAGTSSLLESLQRLQTIHRRITLTMDIKEVRDSGE
jgi:hypothetical protein